MHAFAVLCRRLVPTNAQCMCVCNMCVVCVAFCRDHVGCAYRHLVLGGRLCRSAQSRLHIAATQGHIRTSTDAFLKALWNGLRHIQGINIRVTPARVLYGDMYQWFHTHHAEHLDRLEVTYQMPMGYAPLFPGLQGCLERCSRLTHLHLRVHDSAISVPQLGATLLGLTRLAHLTIARASIVDGSVRTRSLHAARYHVPVDAGIVWRVPAMRVAEVDRKNVGRPGQRRACIDGTGL